MQVLERTGAVREASTSAATQSRGCRDEREMRWQGMIERSCTSRGGDVHFAVSEQAHSRKLALHSRNPEANAHFVVGEGD